MSENVWRKTVVLRELLAFSTGKEVREETNGRYSGGPTLPDHVRGSKVHVVWFTDGTAIACASAYVNTGYCDTCGGTGTASWEGFYILGTTQEDAGK